MPSAAAKAAWEAKAAEDEPDPMSGASESLLLGTASDIVADLAAKTSCFNPERDVIFPRFDEEELALGRVLGRGGFCVVNEVTAFNLQASGRGATMEKEGGGAEGKDKIYTRAFLKERCIRNGDARYAIKKLADTSHKDPQKFLKGTIDLAVEARFLAVMEHPHIIKMRGVASAGQFEPGFYLILDRLHDTLEQRLRKWKKRDGKTKGVLGKMTGGKKKKDVLMLETAHVAFDLSTGLKYMHENNIIYRDLKPDNIGFDVRGDVKIFDFGLAKELNDNDRMDDGTYKLTGFTGSLRYMAPEVAKNLPYNLSADVYSFGMLFWQMLDLEPPFVTYSCKMHDEFVVHKGYRPACHKSWPTAFSNLMKRCWANDPRDRPDFVEITDILTEETLKMNPDEDPETLLDLDISRRSARS